MSESSNGYWSPSCTNASLSQVDDVDAAIVVEGHSNSLRGTLLGDLDLVVIGNSTGTGALSLWLLLDCSQRSVFSLRLISIIRIDASEELTRSRRRSSRISATVSSSSSRSSRGVGERLRGMINMALSASAKMSATYSPNPLILRRMTS